MDGLGIPRNRCARWTGPLQCFKGAAELVIRSHVKSFFHKDSLVRVAVARGKRHRWRDWAQIGLFLTASVRGLWEVGGTPISRDPSMATRPGTSQWISPLASAISENPELQGEPFNWPPRPTSSQCFGTGQTDVYSLGSVRWDDVSGDEGVL